MKKRKVLFVPSEKVLIVDGIKYAEKKTKYKKIDKVEHIDYVEFEEVNEKDLVRVRKLRENGYELAYEQGGYGYFIPKLKRMRR